MVYVAVLCIQVIFILSASFLCQPYIPLLILHVHVHVYIHIYTILAFCVFSFLCCNSAVSDISSASNVVYYNDRHMYYIYVHVYTLYKGPYKQMICIYMIVGAAALDT